MSTKDVLKKIKDEKIEFVDFRFTDPRGKWQHTTYIADKITEDQLNDGIMFDGSSIAGWKSINESDMILRPDLDSAFTDPFTAQPTMVITCDIVEPSTGQDYSRDPRSTANRARILRIRRCAFLDRHVRRALLRRSGRAAAEFRPRI
jgi:glutamine synthetase